jgi:hypothetical protein
MSTSRPESLGEWADYIATLDGARLASKARAANTIDFAARLQQDGLTQDEVETLYILLARQAARCAVRVGEGLYDFAELAARTPPIAMELPPPAPAVVEDVDDLGDGDDA